MRSFALSSFFLCALTLPVVSAAQAGEPVSSEADTQTDSDCEVILENRGDADAKVSDFRFHSAEAFLASVYDDAEGYLETLDALPIRGVICSRTNIIPTMRDFPILATGLPLSLSEDFDRTDSRLMTVYYKDSAFQYTYAGEPLAEDQAAILADRIEIFNLQPHDLGSKNTPEDNALEDNALEENSSDKENP